MPNDFSYFKCYSFGKSIVKNEEDPFKGTWLELLKSKEWKEFAKRRELTDKQVHFVKRGFMGLPFDHINEMPVQVETVGDNEIFPFGTFKGRRFSELSDKYYKWLSEQDWLHKWPTVATYTKARLDKVKENSATTEDVKQILQKIE